MQIRDRIVGLRRVKAKDLRPNPKNWRTHPKRQQEALRGILAEIGYSDALIARETETGLELIDGHLRAETTPEQEVPVLVVDLDEAEARKLLASLDPLAAMAGQDDDLLREVLAGLETDSEMLQGLWDELLPPEPGEGLTDPDDIPEPPADAKTKPGDLWILGDHRLLCGDSSSVEDLDRLLEGAAIHLVNTDPPYNVKVEPRSNNAIAAGNSSFRRTHHQQLDLARHPEKSKATHKQMRAKDRPLENDFVTDEEFDRLLDAWFGNIARVLVPGGGFYIWGGYANLANYPPVLKAHDLYFSQSIIWNKMHPVLTRKDFMGAHEQCQPAEAMVLTPDGEVPIATLRDDDRVIGYATRQHRLTGRRDGQPVRHGVRPYMGELLGVQVGGKQTWVTPNHIWTAKLAPDADNWWCVYLMRKGRWWRIGKSRVLQSWGFGLKQRLTTEGGDEAWILSVHRTNGDALVAEQVAGALYGIPTTVWSRTPKMQRTMGDVRSVYDGLDLDAMQESAARALQDHGRALAHPCISSANTREKIGRRVPFRVAAANLIPELMLVPLPGRNGEAVWTPIGSIERTPYRGTVHSLDVQPSEHYVADGIVTHNCFYGWKKGAAHRFLGPANVPDLWEIKKVNPQAMQHLTEKPVELATRAIQYSSLSGENVLDLFGGSGSSLIACEQTKRKAYLMEIDCAYCDVICQRFLEFTGVEPVHEHSGERFSEVR